MEAIDNGVGARARTSAIGSDWSMEISARDLPRLAAVAHRIAPGTRVSIPWLPGQSDAQRLAAAQAVQQLGFLPMPHLAARRVTSLDVLHRFVEQATGTAGVEAFLLIAGDAGQPLGPFTDSHALIETGVFERHGVRTLGVAGHPRQHPAMDSAEQWAVLQRKCSSIQSRGMTPTIFTQFDFDAELVLAWLRALRERGLAHPVRIGVPGPATMAALLRYAALCGVSASSAILARYGVSLGRLLDRTGPDRFVAQVGAQTAQMQGSVHLHFFPFGGIAPCLTWIEQHLDVAAPRR
ncbi:methylenetetrahydrofolate reductase [Stenotrophomonas sp. C3(2023)]|uniref:methylenetetrahydrofolate reductase n=1 Tax=Stenotrophomonas sp. C3(2023) TaxID=3080277 RepID=UPI00293C824D|nr:methylenetetrahydrofolate reductase [Stenotrophomonas sp. C3(2023)]MDV3467947.1 methylenetetrahydrofolate reductase [Stenotrophomonas sp. C3(2023)]